MIEKPKWNLTIFKINFGKITLKGYTKGEHVLRFEIVHNTKALRTGRVLEKFPQITARLAGMVDRFTHENAGLRGYQLSARRDPGGPAGAVHDRRHP